MDELIDRIVAECGIDRDTAEGALRIILNFLHKDGPTETVERIAGELGAGHLLGGAKGGGGLFGALGGMLGNGAMAAFGALSGLGLDMDQVQKVTAVIVAHARERVGDETVDAVLADIPGLKAFI